MNMQGLQRANEPKLMKLALLSAGITLATILILAGGVYYLFELFQML